MIINHNMASLNTYRQLSINNVNSSKSLEKLSSGLRINKAGDDAAGLAISEKMRGQIRGLDQAVRNSQDGISLIQTAEGALSETHSILQRMRELATQSANDTNASTDRDEIQNEINQLTSEINRIGNTTEFNTQKLLRGDIAITGDGKAIKAGSTLGTGITVVNVDPKATAGTGVYDLTVTSDTVAKIESTIQSSVTDASVTAGDTVDLAGGAYKIAITQEDTKQLDGAATDLTSILNTAGGNTAITLESNSTLNDVGHTLSVEKEQIYSSLGGGLDIKAGTANSTDSGTYTIETSRTIDAAQVTEAGDTLKADGVISNFTIADNATTAQATLINSGSAALTVSVADGGDSDAEITFSFTDGTNTSTVTVSGAAGDGAKTIQVAGLQFDVDVDKVIAGLDLTDAVADTGTYDTQALNFSATAAKDQVTVTKGVQTDTQTITSGTSGDLTFNLDGVVGAEITLTSTGASFVAGNTLSTTVQSQYTVGLKETATSAQIGTDTVVTELELASNPNALTNLSFGGSGALIDLSSAALQGKAAGASYDVTFTVQTASGYTAELQKADGSAVDGAKYALNTAAADDTVIDLGRDVKLTYDGSDLAAAGDVFFGVNANVTEFTLELTNDGGGTSYGTQTIKAGETAEFSNGVSFTTDENTLANSANTTFEIENTNIDQSLQMQIGANAGQSFSVDINDMRSNALKVAGTADATQTVVDDGITYIAKFTNIDTVTNGTTNAKEEAALDVSTHENATAAIKVLNNAIERVSSERSKLGAFSNRLDHTITNLGTSSENMTAAESRIRDVDMAKEMMQFQKNNILSQAAQAMLAQANQQPQGVLQLLR